MCDIYNHSDELELYEYSLVDVDGTKLLPYHAFQESTSTPLGRYCDTNSKESALPLGLVPQLFNQQSFDLYNHNQAFHFTDESTVSYEDSRTFSIGSQSPRLQFQQAIDIDPALVSMQCVQPCETYHNQPHPYDFKYNPYPETHMKYEDEFYEAYNPIEEHYAGEHYAEEYYDNIKEEPIDQDEQDRKMSSSGSSSTSSSSSSYKSCKEGPAQQKRHRRPRRSSVSSTDESSPDKPSGRVAKKRALRRPLKCTDCPSLQFKNKSDLRKHTETQHTKPYLCIFPSCGRNFGARNEWKRHLETQHLQLSSWKCDNTRCKEKCDFNRKDLFGKHVERMHKTANISDMQDRCKRPRTPPMACMCGYCGLAFKGEASWSDMVDHVGQHYQKGDACIKNEWKEDAELLKWQEGHAA